MGTSDDEADRVQRKARADEIRRARDARNTSNASNKQGDGDPSDPDTTAPAAGSDVGADADANRDQADGGEGGPNYVDLIDRKMRELDEG